MSKTTTTCGYWNVRPRFLQRFATPKCFMLIYGLLGTVQAMSFVYFVVSLTTMEKRFKIQSKTTGIMLSGNEISQVTLSLFLSYFGGQRNRPKWIAWGVCLCSLSCFILAMPHFLYGAGEDALALTKEYADLYTNVLSNKTFYKRSSMCSTESIDEVCEEINIFSEFSLLPAILVFLSQFVLGIGNTLYYSLGNTYMDDNTKKTNTPLLLGYACALRTFGPAVAFVIGPICLSFYIDPSLTPLINKNDTRWLGAWWLGWIVLGILMFILSILVGMFPRELPKKQKPADPEKDLPQHPKFTPIITETTEKDEIPLSKENPQLTVCQVTKDINKPNMVPPEGNADPALSFDDFSEALKRILKNKILMINIFSTTFYVLGSSVFITYMAKYIEINYNRPAVSSTIIAGPAILIGVVCGFLFSGWYISKKKPVPRRLLLWNVIVGCMYVSAQISYIFIGCPQSPMELALSGDNRPNLITSCNVDCNCERIAYDPVCHKMTDQVFFSACHAGCNDRIPNSQVYTNCSCIEEYPGLEFLNKSGNILVDASTAEYEWNLLHIGTCSVQCVFAYYSFIIVSLVVNVLGSSSKIGNILVNYRCVEKRDKSFAQGMLLLIISLCALIPGPILYGAIIDSTCIQWGEKCGQRTNCLMYNKENFRYYINITAMCFTSMAVILDTVVWYLSKDLDLYGDNDDPPLTEGSETIEKPTKG